MTATIDQVLKLLVRWKDSSSNLRVGFFSGEVGKKAEGSPPVLFELKAYSYRVRFDKAKTLPSVVLEMEGKVTGGNDQLREVVFGCEGCSIKLSLHDCTFEVIPQLKIPNYSPEEEQFIKKASFNVMLKILFSNGDTCLVLELPPMAT